MTVELFYIAGEVFTESNTEFDSEENDIFVLCVAASDDALQDKKNLTVHITNIDENPVLLNLPRTVTVPESYKGHLFDVQATDPESNLQSFIMTTLSDSSDKLFAIDNDNGRKG